MSRVWPRQANVAQQMNGGGMMQDRDQLRDVVAVCDQWLAGLGPSSMGASLDAPLQVVQQPQSLGDDQVPGLDGLDSGLDMDAYDHNDGFLASNSDDSNDDDNGDAGSLGRAPLIRNDHLDPRGPAERQTSGDTGEGANHADHPFANGFPGATVTNSESPSIAEISIAAGAAGASSNPPAESLEIQLAKSQARAEVLREMLTAAQRKRRSSTTTKAATWSVSSWHQLWQKLWCSSELLLP